MRDESQAYSEAIMLRHVLAGLTLETKLMRLQRQLQAKNWETQPRAPAGQPNGGEWVPAPIGAQWASFQEDRFSGPSRQDPPVLTDSTTLEDGTRILSIRVHAGRQPFDEQHTVTAPGGESRIFETSGETQTVRDGKTGEVLSRTTFTPTGLVAEPIVQQAFAPALPLIAAPVIATFELGLQLLTYLSAREDGYGTVLGLTAQEYKFGDDPQMSMPMWIGRLSQAQLDDACPRNGEVQAIVDEATARVTAQGVYANATQLGTMIHIEIARIINENRDPNFVAELILAERRKNGDYILFGSKRDDVFERPRIDTVCIYEPKTGRHGWTPKQAVDSVKAAKREFPEAMRFIMIQVRPRKWPK
ncbi:hypothetical protein MKK65_05875 [Methylobacterium sp. J-001]|uniref:hypothetical protein n=1 Tax=Methylobacterium sp. J-001 TaxID=2836609 RepID=UPI001FB8A9DF|nr:hypothetical protein [Methylobacterium sp. J-001]MCJ2116120.1 hypothetical protein [Methylobacterium sp. J-001]